MAVTIVDATLVRHHQGAYDGVIARLTLARRRVIDDMLAGLRFVRNRIGDEADLAEFIETSPPGPAQTGRSRAGRGSRCPSRCLPRGPARAGVEITRYRAYQAQLAGHTTGETFGQAVTFLKLAAASTSITDISEHAS